ncbi:MAG: sigma-70 family RNA polymerase sigma factor [Candidatus Symbiothrix sp.]|jgi:RNA polymerase sigma-70 factor (ECF subfamily)|nr:sigma-70 family RNA polymerase sigma factor [Candidatus Symbiothrix sp.]
MEQVNDLFYIQQARGGDTRAFTTIVCNYQSRILTIVMKIVGNRETAEDITQEVFIKVFKSLAQFKEEAQFSTWLYRIAYNTTLSELRKRKLYFTSIEDEKLVNETISDDIEEGNIEDQLACLDKALKQLPPEETFLITLYYLDRQPVEAISKISDLSVSNVKVKLHRIRKKLALEMTKLMTDENR